jgi:hypothetical protein
LLMPGPWKNRRLAVPNCPKVSVLNKEGCDMERQQFLQDLGGLGEHPNQSRRPVRPGKKELTGILPL